MTETLVELERGFWSAAGDGDYYVEHMAPYGLCVLPMGMMNKDATVSAIAQADPWAKFELSDVTIVDLGDDEAAVCYRADASRGDNDGYSALVSTVYTRLYGEWKLTLHQQTPIDS